MNFRFGHRMPVAFVRHNTSWMFSVPFFSVCNTACRHDDTIDVMIDEVFGDQQVRDATIVYFDGQIGRLYHNGSRYGFDLASLLFGELSVVDVAVGPQEEVTVDGDTYTCIPMTPVATRTKWGITWYTHTCARRYRFTSLPLAYTQYPFYTQTSFLFKGNTVQEAIATLKRVTGFIEGLDTHIGDNV